MVVTRISSPTDPCAQEWWNLYESAFPPCERRSEEHHAAALADSSFFCLHLADDTGFVGLLSYWALDFVTYVEHLAIVPERRGQGLGHQLLQLVSVPFILEIEPVTDGLTARRLAFYESCGLVKLTESHVQPAYQAGLPDIPLWLLSRPALDAAAVACFEKLYLAGPMRYRWCASI